MATDVTTRCDIDGVKLDRKKFPRNIQQVHIKLAAEEYDVTLCSGCLATKTLAEIIEHAEGKPGGTVEGAETLTYLVRT